MTFLLAHGGAHAPATWASWTFPWSAVLPLLVAGIAYAAGLLRLWRAAGTGRGIRRVEAACFALGWLSAAAALLSPIDTLADVLLSVHMAQHEILMLLAAPLCVAGRPLLAFVWALPGSARAPATAWTRGRAFSSTWRTLTAPLSVFVLHAVALWIWHLPALYEAALRSEWVHALQHACFFVSAALFWWALLHGRFGRAGYGASVLYVFLTGLHSGALGALLVVAPRVVYPLYAEAARLWGFSALEDQQLAGLLMWVPAGALLVGAGLALVGAWLGESRRRTRLSEGKRGLRALPLLVVVVAGLHWGCGEDAVAARVQATGGDPARGKGLLRQYGCIACHRIPGVPGGEDGRVGPPLDAFGERLIIAGRFPNTPDALAAWIRHPQQLDPPNVMPDSGASEQEARDMAAYLYSLR